MSRRGETIVRTVASRPGGAYAPDELRRGVTDDGVGEGRRHRYVPAAQGVGRRPDRHPAENLPSELGWRHWPCGQNPGRKPAISRRAVAHETQEPRRTGFDLQGQLSLCRAVRVVRRRHQELPTGVVVERDAPRGVRPSSNTIVDHRVPTGVGASGRQVAGRARTLRVLPCAVRPAVAFRGRR